MQFVFLLFAFVISKRRRALLQYSLFFVVNTEKYVLYNLKGATFTSLFAKLSLQLSLCSCKRQIHHFHRDHIRQGLLSRPHDTPWKTRHITFQSCIPLYTPSESMQLASMPFMNFDKNQFFPLSQLWKEHYRLYKCISCQLAAYTVWWCGIAHQGLWNLEKQIWFLKTMCVNVIGSYLGSDHIYKIFGQMEEEKQARHRNVYILGPLSMFLNCFCSHRWQSESSTLA